MTDGVEIKGLSELQKFLDLLPAKVEANIMRGALRAALVVVKRSAQEKAPKNTGSMAANLKISTKIRDGVVRSSLAAKGFDGYKAMWAEFGTKPHFISVSDENKNFNAKRGRLESVSSVNRRFLVIGGQIVGNSVSHPGSRAQSFMRPALDENTERAVVAAGEYIKKRLASKHGLDTQDIKIGDE